MNRRSSPRLRSWFAPWTVGPPRPLRVWRPFASIVVTVVVVIPAAVVLAPRVAQVFTCGGGWYTSTPTWRAQGRCVGLSAGPYDFGVPEFAPVMRIIKQQNDSAAATCHGTGVTIGALVSLTDPSVGGRALDELDGMAAAQYRADHDPDCVHPVRLLIGQLGDDQHGPGADAVARAMSERADVVGVAGVGMSYATTTDVVHTLAAAKIASVGDVVTAEGFDRDGSRADHPDYRGCDARESYRHGVSGSYFYRIAFRVGVQIQTLKSVAPAPDFVLVPTGTTDPYTCTALPLLRNALNPGAPSVEFDAEEPSTVEQTAQRVCRATTSQVTVAYLARGRDLSRFLVGVDDQYRHGLCDARSITVVGTSDSVRLTTPERDRDLETRRREALSSASFTSGRVRLLSSMIADTHRPPGDAAYQDYRTAFTGAGLDTSRLDQGWAVNGYDAVNTIATAVRLLPDHRPVTRADTNTAIGTYSRGKSVAGAGGPIYFDNAGNRADPAPAVVRVCPVPDPGGRSVTTVAVEPGKSLPNC